MISEGVESPNDVMRVIASARSQSVFSNFERRACFSVV
jgi:hypothetical protein